MKRYSRDAWKRGMKVQEVILRALAKRTTWWQAAEIIGIFYRGVRRRRERYEKHGYDSLRDRRRARPTLPNGCRWRQRRRRCGSPRRDMPTSRYGTVTKS